ncbi:MAG: spiro-SPASM protein, partial [Spirochaetales bacterium]|nr:spiro-SPASM protein [Spirochaetales bacterium]
DEDQHRYEELRGGGQSEARSFAERLLAVSPGTVHVQAVRMRENEPGLETFYRSWKAKGATVIVQKYDSFAGCLPDRTVADLSPLERSPCRHLARDLSVLIDGSIPPCKHALVPGNAGTLAYAESMGNAFDEGLAAAWDRMGAWYERHLRADYPEPCGKCDEYHTFNA